MSGDWAEIERALAKAIELPEDQRSAFLAGLPPSSRGEVESLLAAHFRAGSFLGNETDARSSERSGGKSDRLEANTQIGSYRIEGMIGEGGMGVVYRALDTKLNRPVAVKFLFDDLGDEAARRRFQREAQTASSLNHPHILTVYDTGEFRGSQYMVTEFVDAGTLTAWARAEKRTWREIVTLLVGVADGLAAAHAAGILHRDIKPDNILVGRNGYAKIADFGLAKLDERSAPEPAVREPETVTKTIGSETTRPGIILGTIAYMSPEQASGRPTDSRSDIFSFGVVLYELLSGQRPFRGKSDLEVLQTIIHGDAAPLSDDVPLRLRMVVEKAIEKDPADRYQGMRDLVVDLRRLTRKGAETGPTPVGTRKVRRSAVLAGAALLVLLVGGGILLGWLRRSPVEAPRQVIQFDIAQPPGTMFTPTVTRQAFAISPDGKRLAFGATAATGTSIWIRDLASTEMRVVPGSEGVWSMFWGPDGHSIFFTVKTTLKQVNLDTGSGRTVSELSDMPHVAVWRSNGDLLLDLGGGDTLELRLADGSLRKGPVFEDMRWPQFLPGRERLIYSVYDAAAQQSHAATADYATHQAVSLMQTDSRVQYAPPLRSGEPGYLLFIRAGSLVAQPFDAENLRVTGEPLPIAQNVMYYGPTLSASFSVSDNGVLVYQANFPNSELKWYDRGGNEVGKVGPPSPHWGNVRLSRDGNRVAAAVWSTESGATSIWTFEVNGRESRRVTFPPDVNRRPTWAPDGTHLAVGRSPRVGGPKLAVVDLNGNGKPQEFASEAHTTLPVDWSWDGRFIALDDGVGEEQRTAWIADAASHRVMPLLKKDFAQWGIAFAPDGKRIAFVSMESGRPEVYLQAFESSGAPQVVGARRQVSKDGAWLVRWRADSRELFFLGLDNTLHAVPIQGPLEFGEPKPLFRVAGVPQFGTTRDFQFDVSPDGQRFIMPTTGSVPPPPFTVIENWQHKFRR
jgi:Tol biopolymer transport system component